MASTIEVSIILPVYNSEKWLDECLSSICAQDHDLDVELSAFFDSCDDASEAVFRKWEQSLQKAGLKVTASRNNNPEGPKGVGYARNRAIAQSSGPFLCFMDADDVMLPRRIRAQYEAALGNANAIVGSQFRRSPPGSTLRFTRWASALTPHQLNTQIFTSHGPTVIMPTWFTHRDIVNKVGGFDEGGRGTPEDLLFFYQHLRQGGSVVRVDEVLLVYRYHPEGATFSIDESTIWTLRVRELESRVLSKLLTNNNKGQEQENGGQATQPNGQQDPRNGQEQKKEQQFCIWNGGRQGRRLYRSLRPEYQALVGSFCDVDPKKVGSVYTYQETNKRPKPTVPIVHFTDAKAPFVVCVKMDLTGGAFEANLASLNLEEGKDYHHFN